MHIRCLHCHEPMDVAEGSDLSSIICSSCGGSFSLVGDQTIAYAGDKGRKLGRFELIEEVGTGAFGVVWKARDTELDRIVAVKIPRKGQLAREEAEQFLREARAAAQLKHPHIVSVHEVGRQDETVYMVSDFVHGAALDNWLTGQQLTPREAAELCAKTADALHHAHEAGVIHRDLKPGNIMLDLDGEPHLMDFGLARRQRGEVTMTVDGRVLGTPAYMPPEQARGEAHHADRRADIYSLGVILFRLLTGELPFRGNRDMLILQILREEPPSLRKFDHRIPRDLETITLKCLHKNPDRRYQTAAELAADLRRWLNGEPILGRPVSRAERAWRWCKRNPAVAGLTAVAAALLVLVAVVTTVGYVHTRAALGQAEQRRRQAEVAERTAEHERRTAESARVEADQQRNDAETQRKRAEANYDKARKAVDQMLTRVAEERLANVPQMEPLRRELLEDALKFYQGFLEEQSTDPTVRLETANAWLRSAGIEQHLGNLALAEQSYHEAINLLEQLVAQSPSEMNCRAALAECYHGLGSMLTWLLSQHQEAEKAIRQALAIQEKLAAERPDVSGHRRALIGSHVTLYKPLWLTGRVPEAEETLRRALILSEQLVAEFPAVPDYRFQQADILNQLGAVLASTNRPQDAELAYRRALSLMVEARIEHRWLRHVLHFALGNLLRDTGRPGEAEEAYRQALVLIDQVVADSPAVPTLRANQADAYFNLGILLAHTHRFDEAEQAYRKALAILETAVAEVPTVPSYQQLMMQAHGRLVHLLMTTNRHGEAVHAYRQIVARGEKLVERFPNDVNYLQQLAGAHLSLGKLLWGTEVQLEGEEAYRRGLDLYEELATGPAFSSEERRFLADQYVNLGHALAMTGRTAEAEQAYRQAVAIVEKVMAASPAEPLNWEYLAGTSNNLGVLLAATGRYQEAEPLFRVALELQEQRASGVPNRPYFRQELAGSHFNLGLVLAAAGRPQDAEQALRRALAIRDLLVTEVPGQAFDKLAHGGARVQAGHLVTDVPGQPFHHSALADTLRHLAVLVADRGQRAEARELLERAVHHQQAALEFNPPNPSYRRYLLNHYWIIIQSMVRLQEAADTRRPTAGAPPAFGDAWEEYYRAAGVLTGCGTLVEKDADLDAVEHKALEQAPTERARQQLRETFRRIKRKPSHPIEQNNLSWLLASRPDPQFRDADHALELAKKAIAAAPQEAKYWTTLGVAYYRTGDWNAAVAALEKSLELQGANADGSFFLAMAHWHLGSQEESRKSYDQAIQWMAKHDPADEQLHRFRGEAAALLGLSNQPMPEESGTQAADGQR